MSDRQKDSDPGDRDSDRDDRDSQGYCRWKRDAMIAGGAGVGATLILIATTMLMGHVSGGEARQLLEAIMPTSRFLCSALMGATATTLALMLTLVSFTVNVDRKLDSVLYLRIKQVALYNTVVLVGGTLFLVMHCIPVTKSDTVPGWLYPTVYYSILTIAAVLGGALVAVVVMLYTLLAEVIHALGLGEGKMLVDEEQEQQQEDQEMRASA